MPDQPHMHMVPQILTFLVYFVYALKSVESYFQTGGKGGAPDFQRTPLSGPCLTSQTLNSDLELSCF